MDRLALIQIYHHTLKICRQLEQEGFLSTPNPIIYTDLEFKPPISLAQPVNVLVVNQDTLEAALNLKKPLVLNMASDLHHGGGVSTGAMAQEEELFRRTDYHRHLNNHLVKYPLGPTDTILTQGVTVIKNLEYRNLKPQTLDFLAVAGLRNPKLFKCKFKPEDEDLLRRKIRLIYQIAIKHGYTVLVLGALGCGAFNNPPREVARIFKEELEPFKFFFETIIFAVLCKKDMTNFEVFKKTFSKE